MFTIGCDPEYFVVETETDNLTIPFGLPGNKYKPFILNEYTSIQLDNAAVEFNTKPCTNKSEFIEIVQNSLKACNEFLSDFGVKPILDSYVDFKNFRMSTFELVHFNTSGCDPSFNVYNKKVFSPVRINVSNTTKRFAGGHIHIGIPELNVENAISLVKTLDELFIPYCTSKDKNFKQRMKKYGKPGSFRMKPYGIEYRVPSNFWIWNKDEISNVYDLVESGVNACLTK